MFKKIKQFFLDVLHFMVICPIVWLLPLILAFYYWIAVSDLPDWFKFFLLK